MTATLLDRTARDVNTASKLMIVDCDIHPARNAGDIDPYLAARWREYSKTIGIRLPQPFMGTIPYPRMSAGNGMRRDAGCDPTRWRRSWTASGWPSCYIEDHYVWGNAMQTTISSLIFEGVLERFPGLEFVLIEGGFGWVPSFGWRMDNHWRRMRAEARAPARYHEMDRLRPG
jgi:predicted TIM-barrel fold metal-dependent hydrolase